MVVWKKKKPIFSEVYIFEVFYKLKKNDKYKSRFFKVHSRNYVKAKLMVQRFFDKKLKDCVVSQIYQKDVRNVGKIDYIELGEQKTKKISKENIDFNRLQRVKHKEFGYVWIANPELIVSKDVIGQFVDFYVAIDKKKVEQKTLVFDPKYFELDLDMKNKIFTGTFQSRKAKFEVFIEKINTLTMYSQRALDIDLNMIDKELDWLIDKTSKEFKAVVRQSALRLIDKAMALKKKNQSLPSYKKKLRYSLQQCVRRIYRSSDDYYYEDLLVACEILRKQGHKLPHINKIM